MYSLLTQKSLDTAQNAVDVALQRMSSGFRVNSAKDNAAGLYIATKMNSQIMGLKQAYKNTQDGISFLNTGLGALSNITDIFSRIRDLSVQAANGIYDDAARKAMQSEADVLAAQIQQIVDGTNFNGQLLFKGAEKTNTTGVTTFRGGGSPSVSSASALFKTNAVMNSAVPMSLSTSAPAAQAAPITGAVQFAANEKKVVEIDGVEYTVTNRNSTTNDFTYSKDTATGEVTFSGTGFNIEAQKDVSHNVNISGVSIVFYGGDLQDTIRVTNSTDSYRNTIHGGGGDDIFELTRACYVYGEDGNDTFTASNQSGAYYLYGGDGDNVYNLNNVGSSVVSGGDGKDTVYLNGGYSNTIRTEGGDDEIHITSGQSNTVDGGEGRNVIYDNGTGTIKGNVVDENGNDASNWHFETLAAYETKEILIDGIKYTVTNDTGTENTLLYNMEDGVITFNKLISNSITIKGQKDKSHNVVIAGYNMIFHGGDLNDKIVSKTANVTIYGGAGDDEIISQSGQSPQLYGEDGNDTITISSGNQSSVYYESVVSGGNGDDTFNIHAKHVSASGDGGSDTFNIYTSNNNIDCGTGNDSVNILEPDAEENVIIGGSGNNTITGNYDRKLTSGFADSVGESLVFAAKNETQTVIINGIEYTVTNDGAENNSLFWFYNEATGEIVFGGANFSIVGQKDKAHNIILNGSRMTLTTGDLDDNITILGATNIVHAGAGNDILHSSGMRDVYLYGDDGDDKIYIDTDVTDAYGGAGNDEFFINVSSYVNVKGEDGDDIYHIDANAVNINDTSGNNIYYVNSSNNNIYGSDGNDTFYVKGNNNNINAQGGNDYFVVDGTNNSVNGASGTNYVVGSSSTSDIENAVKDPNSGEIAFLSADEKKTIEIDGKTYVFTNQNADGTSPDSNTVTYSYNPNTGEISLEGSNFTLDCTDDVAYNIRLQGDNNTINGSSKDDTVTLQSGTNNIINGNSGNDRIQVQSAGNKIYGNDGNDNITLESAASNSQVSAGAGNDTITVDSESNTIESGDGNDSIKINSDLNHVNAGSGENDVDISGTDNEVSLGDGKNEISVSGNQNTVNIGSGDNKIGVDGNSNNIYTGDGDNDFDIYGNGNTVASGAGIDDFSVSGNTNTINAGAGEDYILVSGDENILQGGAGNDEFIVEYGNQNSIDGNDGDSNTMIDYGENTTFTNVIDITPDPVHLRLQVGANADESSCIEIDIDLGLYNMKFDFSSVESAQKNIEKIDIFMHRVNNQVASMGAAINRLESVLKLQTTQIENLTASVSTIMDADIAEESANFVKNRILLQTTSALMVQSSHFNAQMVLSLIPQ